MATTFTAVVVPVSTTLVFYVHACIPHWILALVTQRRESRQWYLWMRAADVLALWDLKGKAIGGRAFAGLGQEWV